MIGQHINTSKTISMCIYIQTCNSIYTLTSMYKGIFKCTHIYAIYIYCEIHVSMAAYSSYCEIYVVWLYIYPYILHIYTLKGAHNGFKSQQYSESWCILHCVNTAMVQHQPKSMQKAALLAQLPLPYCSQMNKLLLQVTNKPSLSIQHQQHN